MVSIGIATLTDLCYDPAPMSPKPPTGKPAALNIRDIPRDMFFRLKMAAALEHKSVKELVLDLISGKLQDLEKKGLLPKGK